MRNDMWILKVYKLGGFQGYFIPYPSIAVTNRLNPVPAGHILVRNIAGNFAIAPLSAIGVTNRIDRIYNDCQPVVAIGSQQFCDVVSLAQKHAVVSLVVYPSAI